MQAPNTLNITTIELLEVKKKLLDTTESDLIIVEEQKFYENKGKIC